MPNTSIEHRFSRLLSPALAACLFLGTPAGAQTLTIAVATAPTSMDPLFQQLNSNHELALHVYDTLVMLDETMKVKPGLSERWQPMLDPTMWEFKLRRGVKFHDGSPFTAHDVIFSYRRAMNVPGLHRPTAVHWWEWTSTSRVLSMTTHCMSRPRAPIRYCHVFWLGSPSSAGLSAQRQTRANSTMAARHLALDRISSNVMSRPIASVLWPILHIGVTSHTGSV